MTKGKVYKTGKELAPNKMHEALESVFGISVYDLVLKDRRHPLTSIRSILMSFLRLETKLTYYNIGAILNRDHTTAVYAVKQHEGRMETDRDYKASYNALQEAMA